MMTVW